MGRKVELERQVISHIRAGLDSRDPFHFSLKWGGGAALDVNDVYHYYEVFFGKKETIRIFAPPIDQPDSECFVEICDEKSSEPKYEFRAFDYAFFRRIEILRRDFRRPDYRYFDKKDPNFRRLGKDVELTIA